MIDLHIHTTYSDGSDSVIDVLKQANHLGLEYISITDHNTVDAYKELEDINIKDYFTGNIVVGCEINTTYKNLPIELLAYNFDYKKLDNWLNKWFSKETVSMQQKIAFENLKNKCQQVGLIISKDLQMPDNTWPSIEILKDLRKYPENFYYFDEEVWEVPGIFFRKHVSNPNSPLFLDESNIKPSIDEVLNQVRLAGGKVFLAHLYGYRNIDNYETFLESIIFEHKLDGVECYYTLYNDEMTKYLVNFCKSHNLLMSGGSDYHGKLKPHDAIGLGKGNLKVPVQDWLGTVL